MLIFAISEIQNYKTMGDVLVIIGIIFVVLASIAWLFSLIIAIYTGEYQRMQKRYDELKRAKRGLKRGWGDYPYDPRRGVFGPPK